MYLKDGLDAVGDSTNNGAGYFILRLAITEKHCHPERSLRSEGTRLTWHLTAKNSYW